MRNWKATEVCMVILTTTIPICLIGTVVIRLVTGEPISGEAASIMKDTLNIIGGGCIGLISSRIGRNNEDKKST